ncbi:MAG: LysR family transcriptional regulator [Pseudolabrys sp.]
MADAHAPGLIRRIDLTTLQLFVAVCEEGNLTRAATREGIAASAVSKRLTDLEAALKVELFVREAKGMTLTAAGESLLHYARLTLLNIDKIAIELSEFAHGIRGYVRILANLSAIVQFLPEDLPSFVRANGLVKFDLRERPSADVIRGVEEGAAEIGICSSDVETRGLEVHSYRRDRLVIVTRADDTALPTTPIEFADTLDFDHIGLHAASSIYLRSQVAANEAGRALRLRIHVPGFDAVCRMVQAGMGLGMIPDRAFEVLSEGMALRAVPLRDEWAERELKIVVRSERDLSASGRLFFNHLRAAAQG